MDHSWPQAFAPSGLSLINWAGTDHDTAVFAVASIRQCWETMGHATCPAMRSKEKFNASNDRSRRTDRASRAMQRFILAR
jgi:hypothetical protein